MIAKDLISELRNYASDKDAEILQRFFKTGPGQYGEGDIFIGVRVPQIRKACRSYRELSIEEIGSILSSPVHEHRLAAVIIMCWQYSRSSDEYKKKLYELYLSGLDKKYINSWDIIDVSCMHIVGAHAKEFDDNILYILAIHPKLWQKRAALVSCFAWLRSGELGPTMELVELLWPDRNDLIQKATGWVLREVGKQVDERILIDFLDSHAHMMPRTSLRYSIERLSPKMRNHYMQVGG